MKRKRHSGFIERENIHGDKPIWHLFYAEGTKSKQFGSRKDADRFRKQYL